MGLVWLIMHWNSKRKAIFLTLPEIPGTPALFERRAPKGGFWDRKSNEPTAQRDDKDRLLPNAPATYPSNWGPVNIMSGAGFSLVAPSKQEAAKAIELTAVAEWIVEHKRQPLKDEATFREHLAKAVEDAKKVATRFLIWDPMTYRKASRESVMQKLYQSAGGGEDPWYAKPLVVIGIIAIVGVVAILGILVVKVLPVLQAAGH